MRVGRDPNFCALKLVGFLSQKCCVWMSIPGASGGVSSWPVTKFGRVRKNRTVLKNPESEKKVLNRRVIWYLTLIPEKNSQRTML